MSRFAHVFGCDCVDRSLQCLNFLLLAVAYRVNHILQVIIIISSSTTAELLILEHSSFVCETAIFVLCAVTVLRYTFHGYSILYIN